MIKSPAFSKLKDFFAWVEENTSEGYINIGPSSYPFIALVDENECTTEYVYPEDFANFEKFIFEKFAREYYPALWEMIKQPKIMRKV